MRLPNIDLSHYQHLYTPLAIFVGCLVIAAAVYGSGGITIGGQKASEDSVVAGTEGTQPEPETNYESATLDRFAKCLTEKGAKLYAASTCGYCERQKELFGNSLQHIDQIECYDESAGGWSEVCQQAEIEGVPTWIFKDGSKLVGMQTLEALSEKTGCSLQ